MRSLDFSSLSGLLSTVLGLALITLLGVGIRLLVMQSVQQRRERENRQINERLRTLIAAYRTLGGSFTGDLSVDPGHLRDLRRSVQSPAVPPPAPVMTRGAPETDAAPIRRASAPGPSQAATRAWTPAAPPARELEWAQASASAPTLPRTIRTTKQDRRSDDARVRIQTRRNTRVTAG